MKIDVAKIPWGLVLSVVGMLGAGYAAWDDVGDLAKANAQNIESVKEEQEDQSESIDENEEAIRILQRQMLEEAGENKLELQEIRGDLKLLLRLIQEEQNRNGGR